MENIEHYQSFVREEFLFHFEHAWNDYQFMGIFGLKSIGKSHTAQQLAERIEEKVPDTATVIIDHIPGKTPTKQLYRRILTKFRLFDLLNTNLNQADSFILDHIHNMPGNLIMILDGFENFISGVEYQSFIAFCQRLIQSSERIHVIITSCVSMPENDIHIGLFRELTPMTDEESYTFLYRLAPYANTADLKKIAALCGGFPLALQMIGAHFDSYTTDEMIILLTGSRVRYLSDEFFSAEERIDFVYQGLIQQLSVLFQQRLASLEYIPASFQIEQARGMIYDIRDEEEESNVPANVVKQEADQAVHYLRDHHILNFDQSSGRYNIHGILRDCIKICNIINDKRKIRERYCKLFASVFKDISSRLDTIEYTQALEQLSHEYPNLQKLLNDVEYSNGSTYHVFVDLVSTSHQLLHEHMGEDSVAFYEKCLGLTPQFGVSMDEAILRHGYGKMLSVERAKFIEAEENFRTSLALLEGAPLCSLHVSIYSDLGYSLNHRSRKSEAIEVLKLSLNIADELGMHDEDPILGTLINLGSVYALSDSRQEGQRCLKCALQRSIDRFKTKYNRFASNCLNRLGSLKQTNQDYDSALKYFSKALKIRTKMKAGLQAMVASLNNVALQKSAHGNDKEAMRLLQEAYVILERTPGVHGVGRLATLENLGRMYHRLRQYDMAIPYFNEVLKIRDIETPNNVNVMEMLELLAGSYVALGRFPESVPVWEKSIPITPVVQKSMPGYQLPLYCYLGYMEVLARIVDTEKLVTVNKEASEELNRLIRVHTKNKRVDLINRFKSRYYGTISNIKSFIGYDLSLN